MNIAEYFKSVKKRILTDSFIVDFEVLKERDRSKNGHLRVRIFFQNESMLEFSEYLEENVNNEVVLVSYSYHWIDKNGNLLRRWDNTPHFPDLPNAPHHIHEGETGEVTPGKPTNIFAVLDEIAKT